MNAANRVVLNQDIVKRLTWENKPRDVDDKENRLRAEWEQRYYTVLDASQEASKGFSVRVSQSEKVYFIQRRNNGNSEHEQDSKVPHCRSNQGV